ncbi:DUF2157 domain-containing protein [Flagellimonas marinaquae]|uniref:DUF2157 domain-containing protein n=1 Tax=Flagellimonas marinaquae TaxID=254955 RepID=UPI0030C743D3
MDKPDRNDIKLVVLHSNWSEQGVDRALSDHVYSNKYAWLRFLKLLVLTLGISFTVAGIIYFFAYNWDSLNKFLKLGAVQSLVLIFTFLALFIKQKAFIKKSILTGAPVLVGVMYAVFGQIYQTGANAYDFFLTWTIFITIWVFISNFPTLWLIYVSLLNITLVLYAKQGVENWSESEVFILLFLLNTLALICFLFLPRFLKANYYPKWFTNFLAIAAVTVATAGVTGGILVDEQDYSFWLLLFLFFFFSGLGIWMGLLKKNLFYIAIICFSWVVVFCSFLLSESDGAGSFFTVGVIIIVAVTFLIRCLKNLQKKLTISNLCIYHTTHQLHEFPKIWKHWSSIDFSISCL